MCEVVGWFPASGLMVKWLVSLVASSFTFALADVLCDVCIQEHGGEEGEHTPLVETAEDDDAEGVEMSQCDAGDSTRSDAEPESSLAALTSRSPATPAYKQVADDSSSVGEPEEPGLSGAQDAAIAGVPITPSRRCTEHVFSQCYLSCRERRLTSPMVATSLQERLPLAGLVTVVGLIVSVLYYTLFSASARDALATAQTSGLALKWRPNTHLQFWFAMLGGAVAFLHYFFLLKAFEGAPSTVLLPLVQVASVSVLLGSSFVALYRHEPWITPVHALACLLMCSGGAHSIGDRPCAPTT